MDTKDEGYEKLKARVVGAGEVVMPLSAGKRGGEQGGSSIGDEGSDNGGKGDGGGGVGDELEVGVSGVGERSGTRAGVVGTATFEEPEIYKGN